MTLILTINFALTRF